MSYDAERALAALRREERVDHGLPVVAALRDRVADDGHRLVAVDGVRVDLVLRLAVLGLVVLVELLAGRRELVRRERRRRQVRLGLHVLGDLLGEVHRGHAVGAEQLRVRHRGVQVLVELRTVVVDDAAGEDGVGARRLDLVGQRAVVGRAAVPRVVAGDLDPQLLGRGLRVLRDALAVHLGVVEDVHVGDALVLHVLREGGALDVVDRHDAPVGAGPGRVVLVRLARLGARAALGQTVSGVGRGDLEQVAVVGDRDRDRRSAGVELADVGDGAVVLRRLTGVVGRRARLPLAGRRSGVVQGLVLDGEVAALAALLLQGELDAVDDILGLRARSTLQRQGRVDGQVAPAAALLCVAATAATARRRRRHRLRRRAQGWP